MRSNVYGASASSIPLTPPTSQSNNGREENNKDLEEATRKMLKPLPPFPVIIAEQRFLIKYSFPMWEEMLWEKIYFKPWSPPLATLIMVKTEREKLALAVTTFSRRTF